MKALSIRQPWAWLIAGGFKPLENRDWNTKFRGPFLIHAGKKVDMDAYRWIFGYMPEIWEKIPPKQDIEVGGIVGVCDLTHVVHENYEHLLTAKDKPWFFGEYGFMLDNARPLPLMPMNGQLGFFEVPESALPAGYLS